MTPGLTKAHRFLFYLLVLFLPTQLGKHFWPDWSMVNSLRTDYLSPTIYFTDLLILGILGLWGIETLNTQHLTLNTIKQKTKIILVFSVLYLVFNSLFAQNQPAAFYKFVKLVEFILLGIYIAKNILVSQLPSILVSLSIAVVYSSFLAILQFLNQGSLGGMFWFLGERSFNANTPGIAQLVWNGQLILRPYATFPHPNVLAGFLVICLLLIMWKKPKFWWFSFSIGIITLFLTFSRSAWLVFGLSFLATAVIKKTKIIGLIGLAGLAGGIVGIMFLGQADSWILRENLNLAALKMVQFSPFLGVGLNNFLVKLPDFYKFSGQVYFLQPVHNVYLLVLSELGPVGLIALGGFLFLTFRRLIVTRNYPFLLGFCSILLLGLFDHYFYTLQQGQLLVALILGMAWSDKASRVKISS